VYSSRLCFLSPLQHCEFQTLIYRRKSSYCVELWQQAERKREKERERERQLERSSPIVIFIDSLSYVHIPESIRRCIFILEAEISFFLTEIFRLFRCNLWVITLGASAADIDCCSNTGLRLYWTFFFWKKGLQWYLCFFCVSLCYSMPKNMIAT
jgi:hypothetical protein